MEVEPGETAIGLTGRHHHVVVMTADGSRKVKDGGCGCGCEVAAGELSSNTNTRRSRSADDGLRVEVLVDGDRVVLKSVDESGSEWEVGRHPQARVVWHGCGKAMVMEGKQLVVATLE